MSLEIIFGPMFSGKSSYIISQIARAKIIRYPTLVLTSSLDHRYSGSSEIVTHNLVRAEAYSLSALMEAVDTDLYMNAKCIIVEEGQFFRDLRQFVLRAVDIDKKNVIVVGLDGDSNRAPFGQMCEIIPLADKVSKLSAICPHCHTTAPQPAIFTHRKTADTDQVVVGSADMYEALCRTHYLEKTV